MDYRRGHSRYTFRYYRYLQVQCQHTDTCNAGNDVAPSAGIQHSLALLLHLLPASKWGKHLFEEGIGYRKYSILYCNVLQHKCFQHTPDFHSHKHFWNFHHTQTVESLNNGVGGTSSICPIQVVHSTEYIVNAQKAKLHQWTPLPAQAGQRTLTQMELSMLRDKESRFQPHSWVD